MKSFLSLRLAVVFASATIVPPLLAQTSEPPITPTNRIDLFDGKSLSGWTFVWKDMNAPTNAPAVVFAPFTNDAVRYPKIIQSTTSGARVIWSVTNDVIACEGKPYGYARTLRTYRDYQLHVEWRWPDGPGNSGVFLHVNPPDKVWPLCFEAQLQAGNAGDIRCNGGSSADGLTAANPKSFPRQQPSSEKPAGEWNSYDILCRSNTIAVRVNGVLQNEITGASVGSGAVALQAEGKLVEFRNFYLEPLQATTK